MAAIERVAVEEDGRVLVALTGGSAVRLHALWLRENAPDDLARHPVSGQKYRTVLELDPGTRITAAALEDGEIVVRFEPDGHRTRLSPSWLSASAVPSRRPGTPFWVRDGLRLWHDGLDPESIARPFESVAAGGAALREWLDLVASHGAAILRGGPVAPGTVAQVAAWFGHVRETNYGRVFDVRRKADASNLADTGLGLEVHTDNPYRDPVPGLQLLHCLESAAEGGDSILVDGFAAGLALAERDPEAFETLRRTRLRFAYRDATAALEAEAPILEVAADGELMAVRYNNRSLATPPMEPATAERFYRAYRAFAGLLAAPSRAARFALRPGDLFIVDNRRVLHGRTAFTGAGARWLQGCYADRDGLHSTRALLSQGALS
jgi:gamma-butyrobetaine dioxygenase